MQDRINQLEQTLKVEISAFNTIKNALDKAQKNGDYSLEEAGSLFNALSVQKRLIDQKLKVVKDYYEQEENKLETIVEEI